MILVKRLALVGGLVLLSSSPALVPANNLHRNQAETASKGSESYTLPAVKRDWLLNGLQLLIIEQPGADRIRAHLRVNSGALFDLAGKGGLADITAGMLLKGGGGLSAKNVLDTIEQLGLKVQVTVGWDSTDIVVTGAPETLDAIIDLLGRLVISPSFEQKQLEAIKTARVSALKSESVDEADLVRSKAIEGVFGAHPFGRPEHGTAESVSQIVRGDLLYYHQRFFVANNAELAVSGNTTAEQVIRQAKSRLGVWKKGEKVPATFRPPEAHSSRRLFIIDRPGAQRAHAAIAEIAVSRRASDYYAALVMSEVLSELAAKSAASISGDISVRARLEPHYIAGPLLVEIKSPPQQVGPAIEGVMSVMDKLRSGQLSPEQLDLARQRVVSRFADRLRTIEGSTEALLDIELYGLGRDYLIHFVEWINAVTPGEVLQASQKYLSPQSLTIVVSAPASEVETSLRKLGAVAPLK